MMNRLTQTGHPDADELSAFAENALPPHEREFMLAHLAVCAECREVVALSLPPLEEAPLPPHPKHWLGVSWLWPAAALAATAAAVLIYVHRVGDSQPGPRTQNEIAEVHRPSIADAVASTPGKLPAAPEAASAPKRREQLGSAAKGILGGAPAFGKKSAVTNGSAGSLASQATAPVAAAKTLAPSSPAALAQSNAINGAVVNSEVDTATELRGMSVVSRNPAVAGVAGRASSQAAATAPGAPRPGLVESETAAAAMSSSDARVVNGAAFSAIIAPQLPSGAAVLSTAVRGRQMVAIDANNAVFRSNDGGVHWVAVSAPWKGRALRAEVISPASPVILGALARSSYKNIPVAPPAAPPAPVAANSAPPAAALPLPDASQQGSLSGIVTDPTGAAVPNANVTVRNPAGQVLSSVTTGPDGRYVAGGLAPGTYELQASANGFQAYAQHTVPVTAARQTEENLRLQIGAATETVTVTSASPSIELETAKVSTSHNADLGESSLFVVTTDTGERWTSRDGITWRHQ